MKCLPQNKISQAQGLCRLTCVIYCRAAPFRLMDPFVNFLLHLIIYIPPKIVFYHLRFILNPTERESLTAKQISQTEVVDLALGEYEYF